MKHKSLYLIGSVSMLSLILAGCGKSSPTNHSTQTQSIRQRKQRGITRLRSLLNYGISPRTNSYQILSISGHQRWANLILNMMVILTLGLNPGCTIRVILTKLL